MIVGEVKMYSIAKPRIDQKSLRCASGNNCEFFGNAQWNNYCSKCYKEKVMKDRLAQGKTKIVRWFEVAKLNR